MADPRTDSEEAREAAAMGEKPDRGHTEDALKKALEGSDMGSDTRAGSLRGGSASGSDIDPDQDLINETLASEGMRFAEQRAKADETAKAPTSPGDHTDAPTG